MQFKFKKTLVAAGIMSCLFAASAFAETVTTTVEEDAFTQATAQKQNEAYDKSHGYSNDGVRMTQQERSEEGWKEIHPDGKQPTQRERAEAGWKAQKENEAVERDKQTQAEAIKANQAYDEAHGYTDK